MIGRLVVLFFVLFLSTILASNFQQAKKDADLLLQSNKQSDIFRAYNSYKTLYLSSVVENSNDLKRHALEGIIKSGSKLSIDVSSYEKELKQLPIIEAPITKSVAAKELKATSSLRLKDISWSANTLSLNFDHPISSKDIKYFKIPEKGNYRYIWDIKNGVLLNSKAITHDGIDSIKVAQFNPQTLRVVVQNSKELSITHSASASTLLISFTSLPKKAPTLEHSPAPAPKVSKKNKRVVIDAGHGGNDPGAIGFKKFVEKKIVFDVAKKLQSILTAKGYDVYMTRNRDIFVKLSQRTKFANDKSADIFVSIHANAVENKNIQGIETYFLSPSRSDRAKNVAAKENSADLSDMNKYGKDSYLNLLNHHNILASNKLAIDIQRSILASAKKIYPKVVDSGVKEGPFWVLVGAAMPSVLVELGFVTHAIEGAKLVDPTYQNALANGLANGIESYFLNN